MQDRPELVDGSGHHAVGGELAGGVGEEGAQPRCGQRDAPSTGGGVCGAVPERGASPTCAQKALMASGAAEYGTA